MSEEREALSMNLFQLYRRTIKLDRTSSRMKNKDWYRDALELDVQLHCYMQSDHLADCYLHIQSRNHYELLGQVDLRELERDEAGLQMWIDEVKRLPALSKMKIKSLGVILYLTDEFAMAGLSPDHKDADALLDLKDLLESDPKQVFEDKSVSLETHAWRLFPYAGAKPGAEFASGIAVHREWDGLLKALRGVGERKNFPIRTCALNAPLVALASMPWCASVCEQGSVGLFNYPKFTVLVIFDGRGDLLMVRHIPHAMGSKTPRNIGPSVFSAATAYELEQPEIYVFPIAGAPLDGVIISLQTALKGSDVMLVEVGDVLQSRGVDQSLPLEVLTATQEMDAGVYPLVANRTYSEMIENGWALQDFLSASAEEVASVPSAGGMRLLRISRWVRMAAALVLIAVVAQSGFQIWSQIMSDAWQSKPENVQAQTVSLNQELAEYERWNDLLKDRSKGWICMELISRLMPQDGSIELTRMKHQYKKQSAARGKEIYYAKEWHLTGVANGQGIQHLEDFNTRDSRKMKAIFQQVAEVTGNSVYRPDIKGRDLSVKFTRASSTRRGGAKGSDKHPYSFTLSIIQNFPSKDPANLVTK